MQEVSAPKEGGYLVKTWPQFLESLKLILVDY